MNEYDGSPSVHQGYLWACELVKMAKGARSSLRLSQQTNSQANIRGKPRAAN